MLTQIVISQKHKEELFPLLDEPSAEVLAQAALYVVLRDHPAIPSSAILTSPWLTLPSRRFGGDIYERTITFQSEDSYSPDSDSLNTANTVKVKCLSSGLFDLIVTTADGKETEYKEVQAKLDSSTGGTALEAMLDGRNARSTIVSQAPPPAVPASTSPATMERLHVFSPSSHSESNTQQRHTLIIPTPSWLLSLGSDILSHSHTKDLGTLRAPMPSLVVDVKVEVGQRVEKGMVAVVLESMKTETVVRVDVAGVVTSVGCGKGEMVEEGKELVRVEVEEVDKVKEADEGKGVEEVPGAAI